MQSRGTLAGRHLLAAAIFRAVVAVVDMQPEVLRVVVRVAMVAQELQTQ
jgi:hypothetical protein